MAGCAWCSGSEPGSSHSKPSIRIIYYYYYYFSLYAHGTPGRWAGPKVEGRRALSEVTGQLSSTHPALAPTQAVPCSWTMSWGMSSGCSSSSSREDQALSVASVMANCSATPMGDSGTQLRGGMVVGGGRCTVPGRAAPQQPGSWLGCPSRPRGSECPPTVPATPHLAFSCPDNAWAAMLCPLGTGALTGPWP